MMIPSASRDSKSKLQSFVPIPLLNPKCAAGGPVGEYGHLVLRRPDEREKSDAASPYTTTLIDALYHNRYQSYEYPPASFTASMQEKRDLQRSTFAITPQLHRIVRHAHLAIVDVSIRLHDDLCHDGRFLLHMMHMLQSMATLLPRIDADHNRPTTGIVEVQPELSRPSKSHFLGRLTGCLNRLSLAMKDFIGDLPASDDLFTSGLAIKAPHMIAKLGESNTLFFRAEKELLYHNGAFHPSAYQLLTWSLIEALNVLQHSIQSFIDDVFPKAPMPFSQKMDRARHIICQGRSELTQIERGLIDSVHAATPFPVEIDYDHRTGDFMPGYDANPYNRGILLRAAITRSVNHIYTQLFGRSLPLLDTDSTACLCAALQDTLAISHSLAGELGLPLLDRFETARAELKDKIIRFCEKQGLMMMNNSLFPTTEAVAINAPTNTNKRPYTAAFKPIHSALSSINKEDDTDTTRSPNPKRKYLLPSVKVPPSPYLIGNSRENNLNPGFLGACPRNYLRHLKYSHDVLCEGLAMFFYPKPPPDAIISDNTSPHADDLHQGQEACSVFTRPRTPTAIYTQDRTDLRPIINVLHAANEAIHMKTEDDKEDVNQQQSDETKCVIGGASTKTSMLSSPPQTPSRASSSPLSSSDQSPSKKRFAPIVMTADNDEGPLPAYESTMARLNMCERRIFEVMELCHEKLHMLERVPLETFIATEPRSDSTHPMHQIAEPLFRLARLLAYVLQEPTLYLTQLIFIYSISDMDELEKIPLVPSTKGVPLSAGLNDARIIAETFLLE